MTTSKQILPPSPSLNQKAHGAPHIQEMEIMMARAAATIASYRSADRYNIKAEVNHIEGIGSRHAVEAVKLAAGTNATRIEVKPHRGMPPHLLLRNKTTLSLT